MKVKSAPRKRCRNCQFVKRKGVLRVICKNRNHNQKQG